MKLVAFEHVVIVVSAIKAISIRDATLFIEVGGSAGPYTLGFESETKALEVMNTIVEELKVL